MKKCYTGAVVVLLYGLLIRQVGLAQDPENRYIVRFIDKVGTPYSLAAPDHFLSARALARRRKHNVVLKAEDLPVSPYYVEGLQALGVEVYFTSRWINAALVQCNAAKVLEIEQLSYVASVVFVAPGRRLRPCCDTSSYPRPEPKAAQPKDSIPFLLNHLQNRILGASEMHQMGFRGEGMLIAVTDGGFLGTDSSAYFHNLHKEKRVVDAYDFVSNLATPYSKGDHGTSVLSTMTAQKEGEFVGMAPKAQYALYVTEDGKTEYRIEEYNWLFAAERADSLGADIIQTSLGYKNFDTDTMSYALNQLDGRHALVSRAATWAQERGILVITAMGNSGTEGIGAPADSPGALSVAAVDMAGHRASFSSIGTVGSQHSKPDLAALGVFTVCVSSKGLTMQSGTSLATPLISGLAAGLWQAFPKKRHDEIADILRKSADQATKPDHLRGYGIPNFMSACKRAAPQLYWHTNDKLLPTEGHHTLSVSNLLQIKCAQWDSLYEHTSIEARLWDASAALCKKMSDIHLVDELLWLNFNKIPRGLYVLELHLKYPESARPRRVASSWIVLH